MNCALLVTPYSGSARWTKEISADGRAQIEGWSKNHQVVQIPAALLYPVRTSCAKFAQDFFLPTTVNHAVKVHNCMCKILAIICSLVLDICTFPVRVVTCIPRIISNARTKPCPILTYLKSEGAPKGVLTADCVNLLFSKETTKGELGFSDNKEEKVLIFDVKQATLHQVPDIYNLSEGSGMSKI